MRSIGRSLLFVIFAASSATAVCAHVHATQPVVDEATSTDETSDPFAPVFIVTSPQTFALDFSKLASADKRLLDSAGRRVVIAQFQSHQLQQISHQIHAEEHRCGGYFAFSTYQQALDFVRSDRTAKAMALQTTSYTIDNQVTVSPWIELVEANRIRDTIDHLSTTYPNRYYSSSSGRQAAIWIRDSWLALGNGRSDVSAELWEGCGNCSTQPSVILTIEGTTYPDEIVVLGGHLDSISNSGSGDLMNAPGADDDASGIATLTEVLRIALTNGWKPQRTVKFMGYAAEEVGLRGSASIAQDFASRGLNVVGVLQLDMTNYRNSSSDPEMLLITDFSNPALQQFFRDLFDTYLVPKGMTRGTYTCGYGCSDHASWTAAGFPSGMWFEPYDNPRIHTTGDTLANMGSSGVVSVPLAQMGLAFLGELAKTDGVAWNPPPNAGFGTSINGLGVSFIDTSTDSNGSVTAWSWDFGDGSSSTLSNPSHTYASAGSYSVQLTVADNQGATASVTHGVNVANSGSNVLQKAVPISGLSAARYGFLLYTLQVPVGASNLSFRTSGGSGDADMYVRFGSVPSNTTFDCKSESSSSTETCQIASPAAGTWYVRLYGYSAFSGVSLVGDYSPASQSGGVLQPGVPVDGLAESTGNELLYRIDVPEGAANLRFDLSGGAGDADMYVRFGSVPTDTSFGCRPYKTGNTENCRFASPAAGIWYVRIKAYSSFSGLRLLADFDADQAANYFENANDVAIADRSTVESSIVVTGRAGNAPASLRVDVDIRHSYIGDLIVTLLAPDGSSHVLHNGSGGSSDDIHQSYTVNASSSAANGTWRLRVQDRYRGDTGVIDRWSLTF